MTNDPKADARTDTFWMLWRQARLSEIDALERDKGISLAHWLNEPRQLELGG